ncbi:MAG: AIR synthase related protein [Geovibrio sp.]|nr:AIR synthase related protein [Geovibrio sp.]
MRALPAAPLSKEAPKYNRPYARGAYMDELNSPVEVKEPDHLKGVLLKLLAAPNIASKKWVYTQYDHMVRIGTTVLPGSDASVIRVPESKKGIALSADCNSRFCRLDPRTGGMAAIAESARNVAVSGARPRAFTNCLNFGNPEKPDIMWQFVEAVEGMAEAGKALETPVVSGNVSLYNETEGKGVYPTPTIVMVGVIDDVEKAVTSTFKLEGSSVYLLGENTDEIGGSEYLSTIHGIEKGMPPKIDLEKEKKLINLLVEAAEKELMLSAHDTAEGGLAVAVAEMCFGEKQLGARINLDDNMRTDHLLFGETQGRVIVEAGGFNSAAFEKLAEKHGVKCTRIGTVEGAHIVIKHQGRTVIKAEVQEAADKFLNSIGEWMK